jgi:hypothetical protein
MLRIDFLRNKNRNDIAAMQFDVWRQNASWSACFDLLIVAHDYGGSERASVQQIADRLRIVFCVVCLSCAFANHHEKCFRCCNKILISKRKATKKFACRLLTHSVGL